LPQNIEIERRLAAVLAADVAGFSRLTEADEVGTMRMLTAQRTILDAAIARHRGRIANTAGDSVLAEFPSAVNAVQCAVDAQQALRDAAEGTAEDKRVLFRIGIHVGDVMVRGGDLLGSGVNVAARLESLADAGGIIISAAAHEQVKKILPLAYSDLGPQQVKNIEEPVRAFAIGSAPAGATVALPGEGKPLPLPDKPSIAVLPFQNMSGDPEQDYFADGMVEDIITALSRFKSLFVIARNSSFTYKGKAVDIKQVGRELGVRYVLEGSVRKAGQRVRITGQLIEAASGMHLWADKFDGALQDIFDLQDKVTELVVGAIAPTVDSAEIVRTRMKRPENLDAYDHLLKAREILMRQQGDRVLMARAFDHARNAIRLAPEHAAGYAVAAACFTQRYMEGQLDDPERDGREALALAKRAIELAPDDSQILSMAGNALGNFEPGGAVLILERAVELNPNSAYAWGVLAWTYLFRGQHNQALNAVDRALRLNPNDPAHVPTFACRAMTLFLLDRRDEAVLWAERAYQLDRTHMIALRVVAITAASVGNRQRAHMAYRQVSAGGFTRQLERLRRNMKREGDFAKIAAAIQLASVAE
jgi:adenylate cyclase